MPRVSILLPTHNRADVLGYALKSVLSQTFADFEVLVVADGCTDGTADVVRSFQDPRIRLFEFPKAPFFGYANRNRALREAHGDVVAIAAHDDLLLPDHLERMVGALDRTGADWMYSRPLWVSTDGYIVPFCTNLENADEREWFRTVENTIPAGCIVHRRDCLERCGYWPEDVPSGADWHLWRRMLKEADSARRLYVPEPTMLHFSADWRNSRSAGRAEVQTLVQLAEAASWWPRILAHDVPDDALEQEVIFEAMRAGGVAWCAELRAAVGLVVDRLAWDDVREVRPLLRVLEGEFAALRAECERLVAIVAERERLAASMEAERERLAAAAEAARAASLAADHTMRTMLNSRSWRVTAPIRAARRLLGR